MKLSRHGERTVALLLTQLSTLTDSELNIQYQRLDGNAASRWCKPFYDSEIEKRVIIQKFKR